MTDSMIGKVDKTMQLETVNKPFSWENAARAARRCAKRVIVHFVGFTDDRYWSAVKIWGRPHFIHRGWDLRALRDIGEDDMVIFAEGEHDQEPRRKSFNDIDERWL